jgi:N-acetyl-gamma-glutamyl-phosphate reductase
MAKIRVAVLGASGYTGAELLRLLLGHPGVELVAVCAERSAGKRLGEVFPQFRAVDRVLERADPAALAGRVDVAFSCLPHGESARLCADLVGRGVRVLDLSADFRLRDREAHRAWYGDDHAGALAGEAVYGLVERHRASLVGARLVAVPGCYPTAATLSLAPLLAAGLIERRGIVVDAKSGVSGAGRSPSLATHLPEAGEGIRPYKVAGAHRHTAEIEQELGAVAGTAVRVTFTPHLVPMSRGILSIGYATPTDPARPAAAYQEALAVAYAGEPFVDVLGPDDALPDTAFVRGSNRVQVAVRVDARAERVLAIAAIDNLVKGAAGQALQCFNVVHGLPETTGLAGVAMFP